VASCFDWRKHKTFLFWLAKTQNTSVIKKSNLSIVIRSTKRHHHITIVRHITISIIDTTTREQKRELKRTNNNKHQRHQKIIHRPKTLHETIPIFFWYKTLIENRSCLLLLIRCGTFFFYRLYGSCRFPPRQRSYRPVPPPSNPYLSRKQQQQQQQQQHQQQQEASFLELAAAAAAAAVVVTTLW